MLTKLQKSNNKIKITIVGPPNSGKTTIKKVYFEMANPMELLQKSLKTTKGLNSNTFTFFDLDLGVFDLAGQENDNWFSKEKVVFTGSNIIICVFDITSPLDSITQFFVKLLEIKEDIELQTCKVIIFLHKIDLVNASYPNVVSNFIKKQIKLRKINEENIKIYKTSITKDYFFNTYKIITDILILFHEIDLRAITKQEYNNLEVELSIILKCRHSIKHYNDDIAKYYHFSSSTVKFHLDRLEHLGFIRYAILEPFAFFLTNRAYWFKIGLEKEEEKVLSNKFNIGIELLHTFLNFEKSYP
jgi:small GTP-binding protein